MRLVALIAAILMLASSDLVAASPVGVRDIVVPVMEREAALDVSVWYPTNANGNEVLVGDSAVFRGTPALHDAPMADGRFPLVLISHGGFRAAPNLASWLASALAKNDFVAVIVRPPAIPNGSAKQSVLSEFWLRPADFSATITAVENDVALAGHIDMESIGGVGFFLGGYAVLGLAGARADREAFMRSCEGTHRAFDCSWFAKGGVDLHHVDAARLGRPNLDPRLKVAIAVDPDWAGALTKQSLRSISTPVHLINLGPQQGITSGFDAAELASMIPDASHRTIQNAGRFSSFPECQPEGSAILESEGDFKMCDDGTGRSRAAIHGQLASMITTALQKSLRSP